jgi:hypothetical protein
VVDTRRCILIIRQRDKIPSSHRILLANRAVSMTIQPLEAQLKTQGAETLTTTRPSAVGLPHSPVSNDLANFSPVASTNRSFSCPLLPSPGIRPSRAAETNACRQASRLAR